MLLVDLDILGKEKATSRLSKVELGRVFRFDEVGLGKRFFSPVFVCEHEKILR